MTPAEGPDAFLERFAHLHPRKIDLSLGRVERLLANLGHPERRVPPVVHVAGTNGKGSTVAFMRAVLEAAGRRVHVYTSPHLVRFNERIRLGAHGGGQLIDDDTLAAVLAECERVNAGQSISLFEITTAAAFLAFARTPADVLLLEVGLGGRFDATNVVPRPAVTVVTPVSIDHPEFLGSTVERIAFEKAGILKRHVPAVLAPQGDAAMAVLCREAEALGLRPLVGGQDFSGREERGRFVYEDETVLLDLPLPRLPGRHQHINAATAIAALRVLDPEVSTTALEAGLLATDWPARLQRLTRGPLVDALPSDAELWLDGGHNADGGRVLADAMADAEERFARPLVLVCGMLTTKDPAAFLAPFRGLAQIILTVPVSGDHGGFSADALANAAADAGFAAKPFASLSDALRHAGRSVGTTAPRVLITGSLYLAGEVLALSGIVPA